MKSIFFALFFLVLIILLNIPSINALDISISLSIYNVLNHPFLTSILNLISNYTLGTLYGVIFVLGAIAFRKEKKLGLFFILSTTFLEILIYTIKFLIDRTRPFIHSENIVYLGTSFINDSGFPSGHTSLAFFLAFFVSYIFKANKKIKIFVYIIATLVGISRIALGSHYFLDVLGGVVLGTFFGLIAKKIWYSFYLHTTRLR